MPKQLFKLFQFNIIFYQEIFYLICFNPAYFQVYKYLLLLVSQNHLKLGLFLLIIIILHNKQTVEFYTSLLHEKMDSIKIYDTQFVDLKHEYQSKTIRKLFEFSNGKDNTNNCFPDNSSKRTVLPDYHFNFTKYDINEYVEYTIVLEQQYTVLGRKRSINHSFKTRYSMLEKLSEKLKIQGFPPKKLFGNKNKAFVAQRMVELQNYLNTVARRKSKEFLKFVRQIKSIDELNEMNQEFKLP